MNHRPDYIYVRRVWKVIQRTQFNRLNHGKKLTIFLVLIQFFRFHELDLPGARSPLNNLRNGLLGIVRHQDRTSAELRDRGQTLAVFRFRESYWVKGCYQSPGAVHGGFFAGFHISGFVAGLFIKCFINSLL